MKKVKIVTSIDLVTPKYDYIFDCMMDLVESVYDLEHRILFKNEIKDSDDMIIAYIEEDGLVVGLGCITESPMSFGVYELLWGMVDKRYRGKGYGKMLIDERLDFILKSKQGKHTPTDVLVITASPWHLSRCGFEIIREMNSGENEVLMHKKLMQGQVIEKILNN